MTARTHLIEGEGAPTTPPPSIGAHYIDTTSGDQYLAAGTTSATDWRLAVQMSSGATLIENSGTYVIEQTTRLVYVDLMIEGNVTLNLSPAMVQGIHSFELILDGDPENPRDLIIQGASESHSIVLGNSHVQSFATYGGPGANGELWQMTPGPAYFVWVRVMLTNGTVHLLEQASAA